MESGNVVEFIDSQKMVCAVILEIKNLRLRLLTENNREVKMSVGRLSHRSNLRLDPSANRDKLVTLLKEIAARRRSMCESIDIQALWEVLNTEQEWIDLTTMTSFCFPETTNSDHEAAVLHAFFNDRLYFKFSLEGFFPNPQKKVEQIIAQRNETARMENIVEQGGQWMAKIIKGQQTARPAEGDAIIEALVSFYLFEKESPHRDIARKILKKAGATTPATIFAFMVKIGAWGPHENLDLLRHDISVDLPDRVQQEAGALCEIQPQPLNQRRDLRDLPAITIDGPGTLDYDDAVSITGKNGRYQLGIHIADVAHYVNRGCAIDEEAMTRASSIYMPDRKIPMLPQCLSEDACSLKAGRDRLAVSTLITITPTAEIIGFEIVPSVIRVAQQLTYQDVDAMHGHDPTITALHAIAERYRSRRLDKGALNIDLPEIAVWIDSEGTPMVSKVNRESPGRMLVAELMIMTNELAARFLTEHLLPAVFRSQPEPHERLFDRDQGSLFQNWMQRRLINRFMLSSSPEPHAGLGLPAYVTGTSPIRKYTDLITQRQLRAALGLETPYTVKEMDYLIAGLETVMGNVGRIQYRRHRYWLLKYLEGRVGKKEEALVLHKRRDGYAILLPAYMIECQLSGAENIKLKPEDLIRVTLQHVNARNDVISVYFG